MQSMGIGGGFVGNIYKSKDKKAYSVNAREVAPLKVRADMFKTEQDTYKGPLSIGVPGEIKGYWELYKRFGGSVPWKDLIEPSIKLCETGFVMSKHMSENIDETHAVHFK